MRARVPELEWRVMDIRELEQHASTLGGPATWDVIVDKGVYFLLFLSYLQTGTMDALMAENGSVWNPSEQVLQNVAAEVQGVLQYVNSVIICQRTYAQLIETCHGPVPLLHIRSTTFSKAAYAARCMDDRDSRAW